MRCTNDRPHYEMTERGRIYQQKCNRALCYLKYGVVEIKCPHSGCGAINVVEIVEY